MQTALLAAGQSDARLDTQLFSSSGQEFATLVRTHADVHSHVLWIRWLARATATLVVRGGRIVPWAL